MAVFGVVLNFTFNLSAEPKEGDTILVRNFADNTRSKNSNVMLVTYKDSSENVRFTSVSALQWSVDIWEKVGDAYKLAISEIQGQSDTNGIYKATYITAPE